MVQSNDEPNKPQGGRRQWRWLVVAHPNRNCNAMHTRFKEANANKFLFYNYVY